MRAGETAPVKNPRETMIGGIVVILLAIVMIVIAANRHNRAEAVNSYIVEAVFQHSDGLATGADVRIAGVQVGKVQAQSLGDDFRIHVQMAISRDLVLPVDSAAIIETDGLLGSKYVSIQPGGDEDAILPGGRVDLTQGSLLIEDLLTKVVATGYAKRGLPLPGDGGHSGQNAERPGDTGNRGLPPSAEENVESPSDVSSPPVQGGDRP